MVMFSSTRVHTVYIYVINKMHYSQVDLLDWIEFKIEKKILLHVSLCLAIEQLTSHQLDFS